jgi:hypothetical protein
MKHLSDYEKLHTEGHFSGNSLKFGYVEYLEGAIKSTGCKTLLDYGCGKAQMYRRYKYHNLIGIDDHGLYLYDPAVPLYSTLTKDDVDAVICTDVLEHVPEDELDEVLHTIFSKAKRFVFLVVYCGLAKKTLPDGTNAHVTVKHPKWWKEKIEGHNYREVKLKVKYLIPVNPESNILGLTMDDTRV